MIAATATAATVTRSLHAVPEAEAAFSFNTLTQNYSQFCAIPPDQRVFYTLRDNRIVSEKLDSSSWKPTAWGESPQLPIPSGSWDGVPLTAPISGLEGTGPYKPVWDSLMQYEAPEWYQDAKFGIWAHWSPQCVPEAGDWYARNMYMEGSKQNHFHLEHYGALSKVGYKDLCPQWTLLNWDPDTLITLYKDSGARVFLALANHHDGFDAWDSKHHPWNAVNLGPHRDVIGTWATAARRQGLRFGVTVHQARNWWWFQTAHDSATSGAMAGTPYDGARTLNEGKEQWWEGYDPQLLYGVKHPFDALPDVSYVRNFYDRTRDLIDQYDPDLLYFDNALFPLGWGGMNIAAYFYNHNLQTRGGKLEAVANVKQVPEHLARAVVADYERGLTSEIMRYPWQSETCIGQWHYQRSLFEQPGEYGGYLHPRDVIHWLIDTVSKNGTFILNIPGKPDGTIDVKEIAILNRIGAWLRINGEAIYATRPWVVFGEGPNQVKGGPFQGTSVSQLGEKDIRFTRSKDNATLYAIVLGWPTEDVVIRSLGTAAKPRPGKTQRVRLLGTAAKLSWTQNAESLRVKLPPPSQPWSADAVALAIELG